MAIHEGFMPLGSHKDGCRTGWDFDHVVPPRTHHKHRRPEVSTRSIESHAHFVAMFLDEDGSLQTKSSGQMRRYERHILEEAQQKFKDIMENYIEHPEAKRHRTVIPPPMVEIPRDLSFHPYARNPLKRRYPSTLDCVEQPLVLGSQRKEPPRQPARGDRLVVIRLGDKEGQAKWFSDAFKAVQQVACRTIAKVWIKKIHPKKQSTHPYNGLFPRHTQADPSRTRPSYWPLHVIHKEPDHIDRNARTALLVHLIMNTPQKQIKHPQDTEVMITAQDLWAALEEKKFEFKGERWNIITEIITVQEQIERFEAGGYDPDAVTYGRDFSESSRSSKSGTEADIDEGESQLFEPVSASIKEEEEDEDHMIVTPSSTRGPSPSPKRGRSPQQPIDANQNSLSALEQPNDQTMDQGAENFNVSANSHDSIPADQDSIDMTVDPRPFGRDQKPDSSQPRMPGCMRQDPMAFTQQGGIRQGHDLMMNHQWLASGSPTEIVAPNYGLNATHMLSVDGFQVDELSLMQSNPHAMNMHVTHGLPMTNGISWQDFTTAAPRPLPVRTMSTPHPNMMDPHGVHGLGLTHPSYFCG